MGPRIDSVKYAGASVEEPTVDAQTMDILNNPRLSENEKRTELQKTFSELPDGEKTAMYDRLKTRNRKDPVNQAFHYRLSHGAKPGHLSTVDRILKTLNPDHGKLADAAQSSTQAPKNSTSTKGPSNAPVSDKTIQGIRDYKTEEPKTDHGPHIRVIAQDTTKSDFTKIAETKARLESASKEDFKKIITESATGWFPASKDLVTEAMKQSPAIMKRIAKELSPDEQSAAIGRAYDNTKLMDNQYMKMAMKPMYQEGMKAWMANTSEATLNKVIQETRMQEAMNGDGQGGYSLIKEHIKSGDFDIYKRLNTANQTELMKVMVNDPGMNTSFMQIQYAFMGAKDKNAMIDHFQKENPQLLPDLLHRMPGLGKDLMEGINKENAQFIRETFLNMAEREPSKSLADQYRQRAHFIKGWIEESFK